MGEQLDYTTLKWVKDEIQESLNQTQQALDAFIEDSSDTTQIRFCAAYLHQVFGTLQMVEIYGAALLAEEMEKVANALLNDQIKQKDDAFDVLIRAILQLPAYLEGLERGQADMPVVLTPLLNDLRAARGEPLLSESAFFSPDLNVAPPEKHLASGKELPDVQVYARKLRPIYQVALLGWFRGSDVDSSLKKLSAVLRELQNASTTGAMQRLWWVAGGISEALLDDGLATSGSVKMLMGQVDREIKKLIDHGEDSLVSEIPTELLKNCLYYVGSAQSGGPRVSALKQSFDLEKLLPYSGDVDQAMDDLKGSTADIMENVSSVIKEDLLQVKDQLDIFVRSAERNVADLAPLGEILSRTADTLAMLSLADLRKVIQVEASNIEKLVADGVNPDDKVLMEIASALLYVESSLDTINESKRGHDESEAPDLAVHDGDESSAVLLPPSEQIQITNLVIKEARDVLADVKEGFNTFALEPERVDVIAETPAKLVQIQGALAVMNCERAANLLGAAVAYIRNDVLADKENPDVSKLDILADAITSIEYYLEAIEEDRSHPESVLAVAEISVEQLGYPISGEYAVSEGGHEPESPVEESSLVDEDIEFDFSGEPELLAEAEENVESLDEAVVEDKADDLPTDGEASVAEVLISDEPDDEYLEENIDEEILEIFIEEADEVLGTMTDCLHAWRASNEDQKSLETLRRSYHTLKGSGRLAGAMVMGEFAWAMESMLNRVMEDKVEPSHGMFKLLEQAEATVKRLIEHLKGNTDIRPPIKRLSGLANAFTDGEQPTVSDISPASVKAEPDPVVVEDVSVASEELEITEAVPVELEVTEPEDLGEVELELTDSLDVEFPEEIESLESDGLEESLEIESLENDGLEESLEIESLESDGLEESLEIESLEEAVEPEIDSASSIDPVLAQVFRKETIAHLAALNEYLNEYGEADVASVNDALHRALHTLHGSARMAGVDSISELSEPMDRFVRVLHERELPLGADGVSLLREFVGAIEAVVDNFDAAGISHPSYSEMLARISGLHEQAMAKPIPRDEVDETQEISAAGLELSEEDAELIDIFLEEATDILRNTDDFMQQWNAASDDLGVIAELQRALHTIKGGARLAGVMPLGDLTHELESVLEAVVDGRKEMSDQLPVLVQSGLDWIQESVELIRAGKTVEPAAEILDKLQGFLSAENVSNVDSLDPLIVEDLVVDDLVVEGLGSENEIEIEDDFLAELPPTEIIQLETPVVESDDLEELFEKDSGGEFDELEDITATLAEPVSQTPESETPAVDYDPDLLEIFLEEADEIQEESERVLYEWSKDVENISHVAELQRSLHTLKGGARMANVAAVGDLAHVMESLLERIADGRQSPEPAYPDLMQICHDWLVRALEEAKKLQPIIPAVELIAQIEAAIRGEKYVPAEVAEPEPEITQAPESVEIKSEPEAETAGVVAEEPSAVELPITKSVPLSDAESEEIADVISFDRHKEAQSKEDKSTAVGRDEQVRVRADLLNNLVNYSGEINIYNSRIAQQLGASRFNLTELAQTVSRLREQLRKFEIETETQIMYRHETTSDDTEDFDPLELDRFSTMQQISRGMVESLGDLTSIQDLMENQSSETDVLLLQQQRITGDLQDGLMRTRMVAFSSVLPRLRRIVRQTCKELGKQAELHVVGGEGELDRTQLNRLVPALEHILRNAAGHGLEMPEEREKLGKPAIGSINITFTHEGSEVVLTIKDDGRGLDIDSLRNKAVEKGLMLEDADLSDTEIMEFILEAGFSTADKVTQISGRGVGMDVVNTEIKQLGGTLNINSKAEKGSTFKLHLPLTVLVNQALMVQSGEATYAIQLPNIEHVVRVGLEELEPLVNSDQNVFEYAGNSYQYLNLGTILQGLPAQLPENRQRVPLMLMRSADHRIALHVDHLIGRQEIVIKSVGPQLSSVGVLSGATILPDGEVALILDVANLVRAAVAQQHGKAEPLLPAQEAIAVEDRTLTVMIVDDSITVRKVTERLLKRHEYNIITAKDGVDALTVLLEQIPDVMLLDVEMPRMDGYELATTMRNDPRLKDIPIIMITSRTGDKHRQRALDIGVNMYMGKPYQEHELIDGICSLTGTEKN